MGLAAIFLLRHRDENAAVYCRIFPYCSALATAPAQHGSRIGPGQ